MTEVMKDGGDGKWRNGRWGNERRGDAVACRRPVSRVARQLLGRLSGLNRQSDEGWRRRCNSGLPAAPVVYRPWMMCRPGGQRCPPADCCGIWMIVGRREAERRETNAALRLLDACEL